MLCCCICAFFQIHFCSSTHDFVCWKRGWGAFLLADRLPFCHIFLHVNDCPRRRLLIVDIFSYQLYRNELFGDNTTTCLKARILAELSYGSLLWCLITFLSYTYTLGLLEPFIGPSMLFFTYFI